MNSSQDYTTNLKRRIIAATYISNPPPVKRRNNTVYTSVLANKSGGIRLFALPIYPYGEQTVTTCCVATTQSGLSGSLV